MKLLLSSIRYALVIIGYAFILTLYAFIQAYLLLKHWRRHLARGLQQLADRLDGPVQPVPKRRPRPPLAVERPQRPAYVVLTPPVLQPVATVAVEPAAAELETPVVAPEPAAVELETSAAEPAAVELETSAAEPAAVELETSAAEPAVVLATSLDLSSLTIRQLRQLARERGIPSYSRVSKQRLVELLSAV